MQKNKVSGTLPKIITTAAILSDDGLPATSGRVIVIEDEIESPFVHARDGKGQDTGAGSAVK